MDGRNNREELYSVSDRTIILGLKEVRIDESTGKRKFSLIMAQNNIFEYEKKMLCDSGCPYTLATQFLMEEETLKAYYDFTGYVPLKEYIKRKTSDNYLEVEDRSSICDALDILSKILNCIKGMENYLFYPDRFSLDIDAIFIDSNLGGIAFAFLPNENTEESFQNRMIEMIAVLKDLYADPEIEQYFEKFEKMVQTKNQGLDGMIGILGSMQREISYIYYNAKDFRKTEEDEVPREDKKLDWNHREVNYEQESAQQRKQLFRMAKKLIPAEVKAEKQMPIKLIVMQAIFILILAAVFLTDRLETLEFIGVTTIAAGLDLSAMRKLKYV